MRLFVAVEIDDVVRRAALDVIARLTEDLDRAGVQARIAWTKPENLHVTLRFIGETADDDAQRLEAALTAPVHVAPFAVEFGEVGTFPPRGAPRVIWLGASRGIPGLAALHAEVERRVTGTGIPSETRPFRGHLTLGRVKTVAPRDVKRMRERVTGAWLPAPVKGVVHAATLFRSELSPRGSVYHARAHMRCTAQGVS